MFVNDFSCLVYGLLGIHDPDLDKDGGQGKLLPK